MGYREASILVCDTMTDLEAIRYGKITMLYKAHFIYIIDEGKFMKNRYGEVGECVLEEYMCESQKTEKSLCLDLD